MVATYQPLVRFCPIRMQVQIAFHYTYVRISILAVSNCILEFYLNSKIIDLFPAKTQTLILIISQQFKISTAGFKFFSFQQNT